MINLDRLKGSGLLVDQFDEFLRLWFNSYEPNEEPLIFEDGEANEVFERLPYEVKRFYEVVHRWPQAGINSGFKAQDYLTFPPRYWRKSLHHDAEVFKDYAHLAIGHEGHWDMVIGLSNDHCGKLLTNYGNPVLRSDITPPQDWHQFRTSPEEFLVAFAFLEMGARLHGRYVLEQQPDISNAELIFTGEKPRWGPVYVFHDQSGFLWISLDLNANDGWYIGQRKS